MDHYFATVECGFQGCFARRVQLGQVLSLKKRIFWSSQYKEQKCRLGAGFRATLRIYERILTVTQPNPRYTPLSLGVNALNALALALGWLVLCDWLRFYGCLRLATALKNAFAFALVWLVCAIGYGFLSVPLWSKTLLLFPKRVTSVANSVFLNAGLSEIRAGKKEHARIRMRPRF